MISCYMLFYSMKLNSTIILNQFILHYLYSFLVFGYVVLYYKSSINIYYSRIYIFLCICVYIYISVSYTCACPYKDGREQTHNSIQNKNAEERRNNLDRVSNHAVCHLMSGFIQK